MTVSAGKFWVGCAVLIGMGSAAGAQEACKTYTVVKGDNLRKIARSAYGDPDLYRAIYNANIDVIGPLADLIEVGTLLQVPCDPRAAEPAAPSAPVAGPAGSPAPPAAAGGAVTAASAVPPTSGPRLLTGNGHAPFTDEALPGGGMFTQLVEMAIFRADPAIPYSVTFINDWQAHIDALLPSQAYDLSFPWPMPDCEGATALSADDQARCDDFAFSVPFYEGVDAFFAPVDSPLLSATDYAAFKGARICRPEGYTNGVLEAAGLTPPRASLFHPATAVECFEALVAGKADLVSVDAEVGDSALDGLGLSDRVAQNPHLTTLQTLHVIAHKANARAVQMLGRLNEGVAEMYDSGEWYDIVSTALARKIKTP